MLPSRQEFLPMAEWIPIILSFCHGGYLLLNDKRPGRVAIASVGIVLIATSAFVMSGEFNISWTYFLLDFLQASVGFFAGNAALRAVRHLRKLENAN
jgi:hypothetical protein